MKAVHVTSLEGPQAVSVADLPAPSPAADQLLIEVHRAGVAYPDVLLSRGEYQIKPELPFIPGAEVAGVIAAAPDGAGFTAGQRVAAFPGFGGFAEQVTAAPTMTFPIPDDMSFEVAAALPMNYLTCLFALEHRGELRAGETVLVHGASGGVGTAAIQIARALGATVIAVVSSIDKKDTALGAGAHHVVLAEGFKDAVKELTAGKGVDVVVDPVGGDRFTDSLRSLATEGRLLVIGFTGGSIPEVKVNRLLLNNISVVGVGWGAFWTRRPTYVAEQWTRLLELWQTGDIKPPIDSVLPLADIAAALTKLDSRQAQGKVLMQVHD